jgi:hypothetical protein
MDPEERINSINVSLADMMAKATALYQSKKYEEAAEIFSTATERQAELNGEMAPENADVLFLYGLDTTSYLLAENCYVTVQMMVYSHHTESRYCDGLLQVGPRCAISYYMDTTTAEHRVLHRAYRLDNLTSLITGINLSPHSFCKAVRKIIIFVRCIVVGDETIEWKPDTSDYCINPPMRTPMREKVYVNLSW